MKETYGERRDAKKLALARQVLGFSFTIMKRTMLEG